MRARRPLLIFTVAGSLVIAGLVAGCRAPMTPPGAHTTEPREVPMGVTAVRLIGSGSLELSTGQPSLQLIGGRNLLEQAVVRADGDELVLGTERRMQVGQRGSISFRLTLPDWHAITVTGSGDVLASDASGTLRLTVTGSGELRLTDADLEQLEVQVNGSGDVVAGGRARTQRIEVSGSADFDGSRLEGESVQVQTSGSGDAAVLATRQLDARVSGSGTITYAGDATEVSTHTSGSGDIRKR
jgi:hypothetical protein